MACLAPYSRRQLADRKLPQVMLALIFVVGGVMPIALGLANGFDSFFVPIAVTVEGILYGACTRGTC